MHIRIGFYVDNSQIPNADLSNPERGNPGIGGTEFGLLTLPHFLARYEPDLDCVVYASTLTSVPPTVEAKVAEDPVAAVQRALDDGCTILVMRLISAQLTPEFLAVVEASGIKLVTWAQNNATAQERQILAACKSIERIVCVGREQVDLLRDQPFFDRVCCIYNAIHPPAYEPDSHHVGDGSLVTYLGSLTPAKSFHVLAEAWPEIRKQVPQARLQVIGSGALYSENAQLGAWGVAAEEYERQFRPYLSATDGTPHPSVQFLGKMGVEKTPYLQKADVGVVNPTGHTETFCWSAVEFQASGTPVVSAAEGGLLDTVVHGGTGLLVHSREELVEAVVALLRDRKRRAAMGQRAMEHVRAKFDYQRICSEWRNLFESVARGEPNRVPPIKPNLLYREKYLREMLRLTKKVVPRLRAVPPLAIMGKRGIPREIVTALIKGPGGTRESSR